MTIPIVNGQTANLKIKNYFLEDGLSHRLVTRVEKDEAGFLWLATPNGLNRFDGYNFLHFASGENSDYAISGDYIGEIEPVEHGQFLITYKKNLTNIDFLDPISFKTTPISFKELIGETGRVYSVFAEKQGLVYILWRNNNNYTISSISTTGVITAIHELPLTDNNWGNQVTLMKRKNGDFYLFDGHLGLFKQNEKGLTSIPVDRVVFNSEAPLGLNFMKEDQQNRCWLSITNQNGVLLLNETAERFEYFDTPIGDNYIPRIWEDGKGNIIFGTAKPSLHPSFLKFFLLDVENNWTDVSYFKNLAHFIVELESDDFFKTTLFATVSGFKIAVNKSSTIKNLLNGPVGNGGQGKVIRGMVNIDTNNIVIADEDGVWYQLDALKDSISPIQLIDETSKEPITSNCSKQFYFDEFNKILWSSTCNLNDDGAWFLKTNIDTWETKRYFFEKKIESFCKTDNGLFWIITNSRNKEAELFYFDPNTEIITPFRTNEGRNPFIDVTANFIEKSKLGYLWIGTTEGLYMVDIIQNRIDLYDQEKGLSSNNIEALLEINEHEIFIGTNKGFDIFDLRDNSKRSFSKKDGLSTNHIFGVIAGKTPDTYWISTILGLNFFNASTETFYNFFEKDGLSDNEFNRFAQYKDNDGRYYFGGVNGLNIFYEEDLLNTPPAPKVSLTKLVYYNGKKNKIENQVTNLAALSTIVLQPNDKYLELFFSLPDYSNPENNQYQVKLEGYDNGWGFLGNKHSIRYSALPSGTYNLLVKGATSTGNWSVEPLSIKIKVLQAFYKTWQFWLMASLILTGILYLFNDYQLKQKLKVERLRTKLSSDLHDEVSGLLSGIAMQSELLEMTTTDVNNKTKLNKISKVSRSAMGRMSDVIWSIDSRNDAVEDLIARMSEHAMDILDPLGISWKLTVKNINRKKKMSVLLRENLYFIYKEAINNIGKHADATTVTIRFVNEKKQFILAIHNDGQPKDRMDKSHKKGQGTANMEMRAETIGASLTRQTSNGFTVQLRMTSFA
ncbi:MAG: triple tyrosine motif-containing protein [Saprospiraceae bacterium]